MALFRCKMCGGTLDVRPGESTGVCEYCGTRQTLPRLDDERRSNLYDRANHFRRSNEYDKAAGLYEQILSEDGTDAEAYWSLVLCRYGIEYVEDPATKKRLPTVNRTQYTSILADEDYKAALSHADAAQREIYEAEARVIEEIQKGILQISRQEKPFDVFICYKETDANGRRTPDSVLATELYQELTKEGFKVFFARITLEDKLGSAYEPYIFAALHSARVMVVLGTRAEYFNAVWVKNEWSRYLGLIRGGEKKTLIPAYRDMDPYDLPEEFSHLQALDMGKLGFMQDLIRGIKKILGGTEPQPGRTPAASPTTAPNVSPLLRRVFLFLEDGEWNSADEYCEKVLDQDPENAEAYLGKALAELRLTRRELLGEGERFYDDNGNYQKALRFASPSLKAELEGYRASVTAHIEQRKNEEAYRAAAQEESAASTEADYLRAEESFRALGSFRDAAARGEECARKAETARKDGIYARALSAMKPDRSESYAEAIPLLESISGWRDADEQAELCRRRIEEIRLEEERRRQEAERRKEERRQAAAAAKEKAKKALRITVPAVLALAILAVAGVLLLQRQKKVDAAMALVSAGEYDAGYAQLEELGLHKRVTASLKERGDALLAEEDYDGAYALYEQANDTESILSSKLFRAENAVAAGDNETAKALLAGLTDPRAADILANIAAAEQVALEAAQAEAEAAQAAQTEAPATGGKPTLGLTVGVISDSTKSTYSISDGLIVLSVDPNSDCKAKGIRIGDILLKINGESLSSPDQLEKAVENLPVGGTAKLTGWHQFGQRYNVTVTIVSEAQLAEAEEEILRPGMLHDDRSVIASDGGGIIAVGRDGTARYVYYTNVGRDSATQKRIRDTLGSWDDLIAVAGTRVHTLDTYCDFIGLRSDGTVIGATDRYKDVAGWKDIVAITAGGNLAAGLRSDGTVVLTKTDGKEVAAEKWTDITAISRGGTHLVGLRSDGTVISVGSNNMGQSNVSDWTDIVAVSAGFAFTVGLRSDGTVVAVGVNGSGQCNVSSWTDIVAVCAGGSHTVGLRSDGTVVAVGNNQYGQCNVSGWRGIVAIYTDQYRTFGLQNDGSLTFTETTPERCTRWSVRTPVHMGLAASPESQSAVPENQTAAPTISSTAAVGDHVVFGRYEQDADETNGPEPIEWIVLDRDGGKVLLLSRYGLNKRPYHPEFAATTWEKCSLRSWLNNDFLNIAFGPEEQKHIPAVMIETKKNPLDEEGRDVNTKDSVFLLSIQEAYQYFSSDEERQCYPTAAAGNPGERVWWWLRSPGSMSHFAANIDNKGVISIYGDNTDLHFIVRPAMWVDVSGLPTQIAGTDLYWKVEKDVLTISGQGAMPDFSNVQELPWGTDIKAVVVEEGVTSIGNNAFCGCRGLKTVRLPEGLVNIGNNAFEKCWGLTSVTLPEGLTSIGSSVFSDCLSLQSITLPESVTSIGTEAFANCSGLRSINLPEGLTSIGRNVFQNCSALRTVYFGGTEEQWNATFVVNNHALLNAEIVFQGE